MKKHDQELIGRDAIISSTDSVYPRKRAKIVKVDERDGRLYVGLNVEQYGVDHVVWRYGDEVGVLL